MDTIIRLGGQASYYNRHGYVPEFDPSELEFPFWRWWGRIYMEKPEGGRVLHPSKITPVEARLIHADETGRLWNLTFIWGGGFYRREIRVVNVWNATPEKDGTHQRFMLRVPRNSLHAREAVAWTFRKSIHEYSPNKET